VKKKALGRQMGTSVSGEASVPIRWALHVWAQLGAPWLSHPGNLARKPDLQAPAWQRAILLDRLRHPGLGHQSPWQPAILIDRLGHSGFGTVATGNPNLQA